MNGQRTPPKRAAPARGGIQRWRTAGVCLALAAMTFAVFGQTLGHEFVDYDDSDYVYNNPVVARGLTLRGVAWAFSRAHFSNWHPLTWLSHMLDCQLYGLRPGGHHLTNVLLHAATVIGLFLVLRLMTGAFWRSAFVAAVFAIHPLRVESVAWVAERKDVLSGLFFILTIGAYVRYARGPRSPLRHGLVMLLFALGLMCKPMLVTLPLVLLLLDNWPLRRTESGKLSGLLLEKLPLLALSAASCVAAVLAQSGSIGSTESYSVPLRVANALVSCMVYLGQMVWPARLAVFYPYPHNGLPPWEVALAGMLLAGISVLAWRERRKQPWLLMGWLWYLVMLLPVVGIIQVGRQAHADRYTYLPQIGIYVAVTWLAAEWKASRAAIGGVMTAALAVLMLCAWKQTGYWQNSETLWTHALACTRDNYLAHNNLGNILYQKGRVDEAIVHDEAALQIRPHFAEAHFNLGLALSQKGKVEDGIAQFQEALRNKPDYPEAHYTLGNALCRQGRVDEAIVQFQEALKIKPDLAEAHNNLGTALHQKGRLDESISQYQMALQIKPDNESVHVNLAYALLQKGGAGQAIAQFQEALRLDPADVEVQNNLAWLLATCAQASLRNGDKAVALARQAAGLSGGKDPVILGTLAAALAEAGQFGDAVEWAQKAIELARAAGRQDLAGKLDGELQFYEAGHPFHQQ